MLLLKTIDAFGKIGYYFCMIYLLKGASYFVNEAKNKIINENLENPNEWNLFFYDLLTTDFDIVKQQVLTTSFFAEAKIVILYNLFSAKYDDNLKKDIIEFFNQKHDVNIIVISYEEKIEDNIIYKCLKKIAKLSSFNQVTKDQFPALVKQLAKNLNITSRALALFTEYLNFNIERSLLEIEKLSLLKCPIDEEIIKELVHEDFNINIFAIGDALINKNLHKALSLYRSLPVSLHEPLSLISLIAFKYRQVYQILSLHAQGLDKYAISAELGIHIYPVQLALERRDLNKDQLLKLLSLLADLDIKIKLGNYDSRFNHFEMFLVNACIN